MNQTDASALFRRPLLPLLRMVQFLYLLDPCQSPADIVCQLPPAIDTGDIQYDNPAELLRPHLDLLEQLAILRGGASLPCTILDPAGGELDAIEAVEAWIGHQLLVRELEAINSALCAPCGCTLCCIGPVAGQSQTFFEIPLTEEETGLFPSIGRCDSPASRSQNSDTDPILAMDGTDFDRGAAKLIHWRRGWSLILPAATACPHLDSRGACAIYPSRPETCRRPQIFSYLLEADPRHGRRWIAQRKLLAVWDCPYVRHYQDAIADFAGLCGLEPVFRHNRA
ncbi:MAG: YkgJ family cysteine cluster protein [Thermodesulfobacteriota bacterium]